MQLSASKTHALEFPIGDKTYAIPPAGIAAGIQLAELFATPGKSKLTAIQLFKLATGPAWEEMASDGVPYTEAYRVAMSCLAREQALMTYSGPDRWDLADKAAQAAWEAGLDPEALAAWTAAQQPATKPSTRTAAASTTRTSASGTSTRKAKPTTGRQATRSRGSGSATRGRS